MATTVAQHPVTAFTSPTNGTSPIDADEVVANDSAIRTAYNAHDADTGIHVQSSVFGSRPSAGTSGRKFITVDNLSAPTEVFAWYDDGTNWYEIDYLRNAGGTLTGALTISTGGFNVTGNSVLDGTISGLKGVTVTSGGIAVTGNSTIIGTLNQLTGLTVVSGGFNVTGASILDGALTMNGAINGQTINSSASFSGTLAVATGLTVSGGGAAITGASTVSAGSTTNALTVTTTGAIQQSLRYDGSNRLDVSVSSVGAVTFDAVGASAAFAFSDSVTFNGTTVTVANMLQVTGDLQANGNVSLGNAGTDTIQVLGVFTNNLVPFVSSGYSLGTSGNTWSAAYADRVFTAASATGGAGLRLPHGAAPSSPVDGDMWTTSSGLFVRINGVTKTVTLT